MKNYSRFFGFAAGAVALGLMVACANEMNEPKVPANPEQPSGTLLVRNPEVTAWSGDVTFGKDVITRAAEPGNVTAEERATVVSYFDQIDESYGGNIPYGVTVVDVNDLSAWSSYFVQDVSSENLITGANAQFLGDNHEKITDLKIWNIDDSIVLNLLNTEEYETSENKVDIDDEIDGSQFVENMPIKDFSYSTDGKNKVCGKINIEFGPNVRIIKINDQDCVYVALYGDAPVYDNNGFWNRIIKITKVETANNPEDGNGEVVMPGSGVYNDKLLHNNEVEINLSLLDTHETLDVEDLVTKLSVHVRYPHDVKVRIPVPTELLVPADDLNIVLSHKELLESFGKESAATFDIAGNRVDLFVTFTEEALDCAGNKRGGYYMEITTLGMNTEVMSYCLQNMGDGVNFEVYNYYQWNVTDQYGFTSRRKPTAQEIQALQYDWLDKSTVEFGYGGLNWNAFSNYLDYPHYYINAFNTDRDREDGYGNVNVSDCYVKVIENQDSYEYGYQGLHLNGSDRNEIWYRYDITPDDAHTYHSPSNSVN